MTPFIKTEIFLTIFQSLCTAHHVHAFLDTEVASPFGSMMEGNNNHLPSQSSSVTQTSKQSGVSSVNNESFTAGSQNRINMVPSKSFDGSLYYRQSNMVLSKRPIDGPHDNVYHDLPSENVSQVQVKVPSSAVGSSSGLSKFKSDEFWASKDNAGRSYGSRRGLPSDRSQLNSGKLQTSCGTFSRTPRTASPKKEMQRCGDLRSRKELSPKSVSFASSVKKSGKSTSRGAEDDGSMNQAPAKRTSSAPRMSKVQSNIMAEGMMAKRLSESGSQYCEMRGRFSDDSRGRALPPSPPTRDTNEPTDQGHSQQGHSIQIQSVFDAKRAFELTISSPFARQSNVNLSLDGSVALPSDVGQMRENSSASEKQFAPSEPLKASQDASLTVEELLTSNRFQNSTLNTSMTTKFGQKGTKEHPLDDFDAEREGLLLNSRYVKDLFTKAY